MSAVIIRSLCIEDAAQLFEFETKNKTWFEQHIAPRPLGFYSRQAVADHIHDMLARYHNGTFDPNIIVNQAGKIVGRANLKDIDQDRGTAEVGYRIDMNETGHGLASNGLNHLIDIARVRWQLTKLNAVVTNNNSASMRVLEKCGFIQTDYLPKYTEIHGLDFDAYQYELQLGSFAGITNSTSTASTNKFNPLSTLLL